MTELNTSPLDEVTSRLHGVRRSGEGWSAFCPAHEDTRGRSLTVSEADDGRVLVNCHKGCTFLEIMEALGLETKDAFPKPLEDSANKKRFEIRDHTGRVMAVHHRQDQEGTKKVWWSTPDGRSGLSGLKSELLPLWGAEAVSALPPSEPIVLCEGEKAAYALTSRSIPAVATVTGAATTPCEDSLRVLEGRTVILWADNDLEGRKHMDRIAKQLLTMGCEIREFNWTEAPEKGDAADHPAILRGDVTELREALRSAPLAQPPHNPATDGPAMFGYVKPEIEKLLRLRVDQGGITGIRTGIPKIDRMTHGLNRGYSYLVAARPNVGKSLFAGQIALTAAMADHRTLLQTPEMSAVQYLERFACYVADVDYFRCQDGRVSEEELQGVLAAANYISKLPLFVDDYGGQTVERIRQNIERHEPDLVVVDYLQFVRPDDPRASRTQQVGQISRDLASLKSDFNIPVVVAAQLNRASESRSNAEPILSDLRDSGELEQDADMVLMMHRPDMHKDDVEPEDEEVKVLCRKNRMGQLWHTSLYFKEGQQWLTDRRWLTVP